MSNPSRRHVLAGSALAAAAVALPATTQAAAPASGRQGPGFYRFRIGDYEVTAINDGTWYRAIDEKFVRNAPFPEVQKALSDAFLPTDRLPTPFTALVVNTGSQLIALDTGTGGQLGTMAPQSGTFAANLAAAGIDPRSVDMIFISHFHPDHINGIKTKDNELFFPNAEIAVPAPEWAFWMDDANMGKAPDAAKPAFLNARRIFRDIERDVRRFEPGKEVAPGIASVAAFGHTPGHTAYTIASGNQSMFYIADTTNNPWLFVRNPQWQAIFDMDGNMAAENRLRVLDRAAADRTLLHGYHFPFPASGHVTKTATGYELVPAMWRPNL
jgi:glyoxylase-like metal-dependent hydrolase (beta-lactamase superfamily II)